jgi:hypothetical protein
MLMMNEAQRSRLKTVLRASDPTLRGVSAMTKAELLAQADRLAIDVPAIIGVPAIAEEPETMSDTVDHAEAPAMSPEAQAEYEALQQAWDDMSPKAFRETLKAVVVRAHKPAEVRTIVETVTEYQPAPAGAVAPLVARQARRAGSTTLGALFGVAAPMASMTVDLWTNGLDVPTVATDHVWPQDIAALATMGLVRNRPVFLTGPKGVGKTTTIEQVAARLGRPFVVIGCSEETELPALVGTLAPHNGTTIFKYGALTKAMQTAGAIILLDEIDTLRTGVAIGLNGILENREYTVPETGEKVTCADGVLFVGAGNSNGRGDTSGRYGGVNEQNAALMSRFGGMIGVSYLTPAKEAKLLQGRTACTAALAKLLVGAANVTREAVTGGTLTDGMSFRALNSWAVYLVDGLDPAMAARCALLNQASIEEREVMLQILLTHAADHLIIAAMGGQPVGRGAGDFSNVGA